MNPKVRFITRTGLLLALTLVVQMIGLPQVVTGPLVNLLLYVAVSLVGVSGGAMIGAITPWVALTRGILPAPLGPLVPFIMVANISLVVNFGIFKKMNNYLAIAVASVVKFAILVVGVRFFVQVPPKVAQAMQTPQLINAIIGGVAALIIIEILRRTKAFEDLNNNFHSN